MFRVSGIYETGLEEFDDVYVLGDLRQIQAGEKAAHVGHLTGDMLGNRSGHQGGDRFRRDLLDRRQHRAIDGKGTLQGRCGHGSLSKHRGRGDAGAPSRGRGRFRGPSPALPDTRELGPQPETVPDDTRCTLVSKCRRSPLNLPNFTCSVWPTSEVRVGSKRRSPSGRW